MACLLAMGLDTLLVVAAVDLEAVDTVVFLLVSTLFWCFWRPAARSAFF